MTVLPLGTAFCDLQPGRLWSLWDMINARITGLTELVAQITLEERLREEWGDEPLEESDVEQIEGWMQVADKLATSFEMRGVQHRIAYIRHCIETGTTQRRISAEYRVLRETIVTDLRGHILYRYPVRKAEVLMAWQEDWQASLASFPSARSDIFAAVDLWALSHSTAAVFHFMRVLEHGLRALAADLGKTFDIQNWQNILDEIESEVRQQAKTLPRGSAKSERLRFLSEAAKEFHFFKDGWRNYVSHNRSIYDEHQARSVMDHVRSFMNGLSSQLSEGPSP